MSLALLIVGLFALAFGWHVHHPVRRPGELAVLAFGLSWWGGELPVHAVALWVGVGAALVAGGGLVEEPVYGAVGLAALGLAGLSAAASWRQASRVRGHLEHALGVPLRPHASFWHLVLPFWFGDRRVLCTRNVRRDNERLRADLYRPREPVAGVGPGLAPVLVYVHGGGWVLGFRRWQGRVLIRRMVRAGWVCVSIQYRLSPWATWPDHIVDVKRALAWTRRVAPDWGGDRERIAISGNSAGGHLAALAALTPGLAAFQPGFEADDTRVAALVGWYGVYDLLDAARAWPHSALRRLWELLIMKRRQGEHAESYRLASPISHLGPHAPPTLLLHGTLDTLVPIASAYAFQRAFEAAAPGRSRLLAIEGAEHAFEVFWSRRGLYAVEAAGVWLEQQLGGRSEARRLEDRTS